MRSEEIIQVAKRSIVGSIVKVGRKKVRVELLLFYNNYTLSI